MNFLAGNLGKGVTYYGLQKKKKPFRYVFHKLNFHMTVNWVNITDVFNKRCALCNKRYISLHWQVLQK